MTDAQSGTADGSGNSSTASSPIPSAPNAPKFGTMIPNRIFVGGISFNTCEAELKNFFSHYGRVRETKIIADRAGVSKGYAFITFESQEEAVRILKEQANNLIFKDKKLNIGQAIRKQPMSLPKNVGYSYTYHNGVAYFNPGEMQGGGGGGIPTHHGHQQAAPPAAVMPHPHQHHTVNQSMGYPQYTVPVMLQAAPSTPSHHQYIPVSSQPQQGQYYQQPLTTTPQWAAFPGQWRWIHPQQPTATGLSGGMVSPMYASAPGTDMAMYQAPTPAYAQTPADMSEMPIMEPSQNEVRYYTPRGSHQGALMSMDSSSVHHHHHHTTPQPLPFLAAAGPRPHPPPPPYLAPQPDVLPQYPEQHGGVGTLPPQIQHYLPKMPIKLAPKRSIKMPPGGRPDRAPKMVRSTVDGSLHYTLARMDEHGSHPPPRLMAVNGYQTMAPDNLSHTCP